MLELPTDDRRIDLWYVLLDEITDVKLLDEYRRRLPPEEAAQEQRFAMEESRLQFLIARVLVRSALSYYTGDDLCAWQFARNRYGKPSIAGPAGPPLEFNLSHTRGLVVCAVTRDRPVGVDAEALLRSCDGLGLARRFFAPQEAAALERLSAAERDAAFLRFWTLKEAFIKARGMGLSLPLRRFAFSLAEDRPPAISFTGPDRSDPSDWQFAELRLDSRFQVALAVERPASERLVVQVRRSVPLRWESPGRVLPASPSNQWVL